MRVALFGGSFDPPHLGHELAALYVLEAFPVDALWFVPCFLHPFEKKLAPFADRVAMCQLVAQSLGPRAQVCTIEQDLGGPSYTIDTVQALRRLHPGHELSLVIGTDLLRERDRWRAAADLYQLIRFVVIARGGVDRNEAEQQKTLALLKPHTDLWNPDGLVMPQVSSTAVRDQLRTGQPPIGAVSSTVLHYLTTHGLYR